MSGERGYADNAQAAALGDLSTMHAGQFASLAQVLDHYNRAPAAPAGHSELEPLNLSAQEQGQLIAFLQTLSSVTE